MLDINNTNQSNDLQNAQTKINYVQATPDCDIEETTDAYILNVDMPGLVVAKTKVELDKDLLSLDAFSEIDGLGARHYERKFRVMRGLDASKVRADYKCGVLTISLPKPVALQSQKIQITCE